MTKTGRSVLVLTAFLVLLAGLSFAIHSLTSNNTLGTDFFIFWQAGRGFLVEKASPYSQEFALRSQMAVFKRPSAAGEDQLGFAYPPFVLFPILPLLALSFDWAAAIWLAFLILAWCITLFLLVRMRPLWPPFLFLAFYPLVFGLILGNFVVLGGALLAVLVGVYLWQAAPSTALQVAAGIATSWLLSKPQFSGVFVLLLVLHGLRYRQKPFLVSALSSLAVWLACSFAIWPAWPHEWLAEINRYAAYNQAWPTLIVLLQDFLPGSAARILGAVLIAAVGLATLFVLMRWWQGSTPLIKLLAWVGMMAYFIHPHGKSYEQLVFLVPFLVWFCRHPRRASIPVLTWWFGSLAASWALFFVSLSAPSYRAISDWPILLYTAWVAWLWLRSSNFGYAQSANENEFYSAG